MSDPTLSPQTDSPWFPTLSPLEHGFPDPLALSLQSGIMVCSAIATVVELGLADVFEEGPASVQTLARQTQTHEPTLYLLLRALASIGIFKEIEDHLFEHTHRSRLLRAEAMAPLVALWSAPYQWDTWKHLAHTLRTGRPAIEAWAGEGATIWSYLHQHPDERQTFQLGLAAVSSLIEPALLNSYDFTDLQHVVDVGGGHGTLAITLLHHAPTLLATLFDQEPIIKHALQERASLPASLIPRYRLIAGDFLLSVPEGADGYLLKNVLMDWSDEEYVRILYNCCRAMQPYEGRVLVIEPVIGDETPFTKFFSLQMAMMMRAARHRTLAEHEALFAQAGFRLTQALPLGLEQMLLEGRPLSQRTEGGQLV